MKKVKRSNEEEDKKQQMTILDAIEQIAEQAENSELGEGLYKGAANAISYLKERLEMNEREAVLLALLTNFYNEWMTLSELATYCRCKRLQMLRYEEELKKLCKKRYIHSRALRDEENYHITSDTLRAIQNNEVPASPQITCANVVDLFERLNQLIAQRKGEELNYKNFKAELFELINANTALDFVGKLKGLNLPEDDAIMLLWCCDMLVSEDDSVIIPRDFEELYAGERLLARRQRHALRDQWSLLIERGLLRPTNNNGMGQPESLELTPFICNELLDGLGVACKKRENKQLMSFDSIVEKQLFYNPKEERSLEQLQALLQPKQFDQICLRLEEKGFRRGFACLFYGAPGTGKTETVLQLARKTGRDLMLVNVAEIKSKWVGESEKNIKALFDRYRRLVKESECAPILFFNEADAIINKRSENAERAVDKMENSMQNIILQEIENLEGILIATTNLTKNIDKAFERRFLYKIEFSKPTLEAKQSIWQSMLPSLSERDTGMLAARYDFSGGQIENIARKNSVEEILTGNPTDINRLIEFCEEERLDNSPSRKRIGF